MSKQSMTVIMFLALMPAQLAVIFLPAKLAAAMENLKGEASTKILPVNVKAAKESPTSSGAVLEKAILQALENNPEKVVQIFRKAAAVEAVEQIKSVVASGLKTPLAPEAQDRLFLGAEPQKTKHTIFVYSDFMCSYCAQLHAELKKLVAQRDDVRIIFKSVPLNNESKLLASLVTAVSFQDSASALKLQDVIFESQGSIQEQSDMYFITGLLKMLNTVDIAQVLESIGNDKIKAMLKTDEQEHKKFRMDGTPHLVVDGIHIKGSQPLSTLSKILKMIDEHEQGKSQNIKTS